MELDVTYGRVSKLVQELNSVRLSPTLTYPGANYNDLRKYYTGTSYPARQIDSKNINGIRRIRDIPTGNRAPARGFKNRNYYYQIGMHPCKYTKLLVLPRRHARSA